MSVYIKLIFVIIISLLVTTCDSGDGGNGNSSNSNITPNFDNNASSNTTGASNEVVCTVKVDTRNFDEDAFIEGVAETLGCSIDDISVTNVTVANAVAYISFIFTSNNEEQLLESIQQELSDGDIAGFEAMVIIANMDDNITCWLGEDCSGICGGDTLVDPCGVCGGTGSDCDSGDMAGLYQLRNFTLYDTINSDGSCSGDILLQYSGPNFILSDSESYNDGPCDYFQTGWEEEIQMYMNLSSNGEYNFIRIEEEEDDSYSSCSGGFCENGQCSYCSTDSDIETMDVELELGTWSSDENYIYINHEAEMEWEYEASFYEETTCGEIDYSSYSSSNGCINQWTSWYDNQRQYEKTFNRIYLFGSSYYYSDYYDSDQVCEKWEYQKVSTWPSVGGCTDPFSVTYNPIATYDDGSCDEGNCQDWVVGNRTEIKHPFKK